MKPLATLTFLVLFSLSLTGCSGTGGGSAVGPQTATDLLSDTDLAAVEASLISDRINASVAAPVVTTAPAASVVSADVLTASTFAHGGRRYQGGRSGNRAVAQRGLRSCTVTCDGSFTASGTLGATIGSLSCTIVRNDDGSLRVLRADGTELMTVPAPTATGPIPLTANGVAWLATYGQTATDPLVTLVNQVSGRTLTVTEGDDGTLTVTSSGGGRFRGAWQADGTMVLDDTAGYGQRRWRGGRSS